MTSAFLLMGCTTWSGLKCREVSSTPTWQPVLDEADSPFEMSVKYGEQQFDGLLAVDRLGDTLSVHLSSYIGLTVFAMRCEKGTWRMLSCIPPLKRRGVTRLLGQDFGRLFSRGESVERSTSYVCPDTAIVVHAPKALRGQYWVTGSAVDSVRYGSFLLKGVIRNLPTEAVQVEHPAVGFTYTIKPLR